MFSDCTGHVDVDILTLTYLLPPCYSVYFLICRCDVISSRTWYEHACETVSVSDPEDILKGTIVQPPHCSPNPVSHVGLSHWSAPHILVHLHRDSSDRHKLRNMQVKGYRRERSETIQHCNNTNL